MELEVEALFSTPILRVKYPSSIGLNIELHRYFKELESKGDTFRNVTGTPTVQRNIFESEMNLFSHKEPCVQELRSFMLGTIFSMIKALKSENDSSDYSKLINHTWFHITRDRGYVGPHNHPMAAWSAVYYVSSGEIDTSYPDSGCIRFFNPNQSLGLYRDPSNSNLKLPFSNGMRVLKPEAGTLIVFPSYLSHEVAPFYGEGERVCVATNCWVANT